jgi:hypothetical protein
MNDTTHAMQKMHAVCFLMLKTAKGFTVRPAWQQTGLPVVVDFIMTGTWGRIFISRSEGLRRKPKLPTVIEK